MFLFCFFSANFNFKTKVSTYGKRWVNIDEFDTAFFFYFITNRAVCQRRQYQFVIAPNQFVCPPFELSPTSIKEFKGLAGFFAWLVYMLNAMKGQGYIGNIFFSSVPKQEYIFFISKKFVNEFLWQFFTCLYQFNDSVFISIVQVHNAISLSTTLNISIMSWNDFRFCFTSSHFSCFTYTGVYVYSL